MSIKLQNTLRSRRYQVPRDFAIEYRGVSPRNRRRKYVVIIHGGEEKKKKKRCRARKTPKLLCDKKRRRFSLGSAVSAVSGTSQSKLRAINCNKDARNRHSAFFRNAALGDLHFHVSFTIYLRNVTSVAPYNESRRWTAVRCYLYFSFYAWTENLSKRAVLRSLTSCVIPSTDMSAKCVIKL